MITMISKV